MPIAQHRRCFARIVVAIVKKENDLAADLALEPASGNNFRKEKSFGKKAARLLAETDNRRAHAQIGRDSALRCPSGEKCRRRGGRRSAPSLPTKPIRL